MPLVCRPVALLDWSRLRQARDSVTMHEEAPMRISTLLAGKGDSVATITPDTTVTGAVDALREHGVGFEPVRAN